MAVPTPSEVGLIISTYDRAYKDRLYADSLKFDVQEIQATESEQQPRYRFRLSEEFPER